MDFPQDTSSKINSLGKVEHRTISIWTHFRRFWEDPNVMQLKLEAFVLFTAFLLSALLLLGSVRQRTAWSMFNINVKFLVQAFYIISGHAFSYVMGVISSGSPVDSALIVVWALILIVLYRTSDNVGSESLDDNEALRKSFLWDSMIPTVYVVLLIIFTVPSYTVWPLALLLMLLFLIKLRERKLALTYACRSHDGLDKVTRVVAEYMRYEHTLSNGTEDATTMQGYKYLVGMKEAVDMVSSRKPSRRADPLEGNNIVTLDRIWQSEGWVFGPKENQDKHVKDLFLSFALFWLLLRRFADYDLHELSTVESRLKTWRFVREGLIKESDDENETCERVSRVVEVELDFLYDFFYNNYYAVYSNRGVRYLVVRLIIVGLYIVAAFISLNNFTHTETPARHWFESNSVKIHVTQAVVCVLIVIELAQIGIIFTSKWIKMKCVCNYVINRWWWQKTGKGKCAEQILFMLSRTLCMRTRRCPRKKKLHQYSLLDSYGHTSKLLLFKCILDGYISFPMNGQKESKPINLSTEVMKAVILALRANGQTLWNGAASLKRNRRGLVDDLSWTCRKHENSSPVILIWHIATSICEMSPPNSSSTFKDASNLVENFHIATSLSKYCAYLVALAPKLLPDHVHTTQCLFEEVVYEMRETLAGCDSKGSVLEKLRSVGEEETEEGSSVLKQGALLGIKLMHIGDVSKRWKILADLWAELLLYLAPSKDASVHAEYLVSGGEFITHLWVLLTHAGIIDRE